jgi:hypothetical protein
MSRRQRDTRVLELPGASASSTSRGRRRLIAGLRVSDQDAQLLTLVAPFFPEADSAGDLAYRLWRRGLELALAAAPLTRSRAWAVTTFFDTLNRPCG